MILYLSRDDYRAADDIKQVPFFSMEENRMRFNIPRKTIRKYYNTDRRKVKAYGKFVFGKLDRSSRLRYNF